MARWSSEFRTEVSNPKNTGLNPSPGYKLSVLVQYEDMKDKKVVDNRINTSPSYANQSRGGVRFNFSAN